MRRKKNITVAVKDQHIMRVHTSFKELIEDVNKQLKSQGILRDNNNPMATKILANNIGFPKVEVFIKTNIKRNKNKKVVLRI